MRCSAYEGCQESRGFSVRCLGVRGGRAERRDGAEARAQRGNELPSAGLLIAPGLAHGLRFKAFPFPSGAEVFFREFVARVWPTGVAALCCEDCVLHQLLSGQLGSYPTPTVSCLPDCGDRGLRPF